MSVVERSFCEYVGEAFQEEQRELSLRWLERLVALLPVDASAVFDSNTLLDHIPHLIDQIGKYVASAEAGSISANAGVIEHARGLGQLRHRQQASVHQVLREYELLAELLEQFIDARTTARATPPPAAECLEATRRAGRAVRFLMQTTVATFIGEYIDTIRLQADRLDLFNRAVRHELRNALGTIQFSTGVLKNSGAAGEHHEKALLMLQRSTDRASQILRSLDGVPFSTLLTADAPTEQTVDLTELVSEVFRQLRDMADARGVVLRPTGILPELHVDTGRLELVLLNLVANAVKYSDPRKPHRFVEVTASAQSDGYEIRVNDNGLGIPAAALAGIFDRFQRAHAHLDATLGVDGTGLGLAIVDECVKALGARIRVESSEGVGTVFIVTLPRRMPPLP